MKDKSNIDSMSDKIQTRDIAARTIIASTESFE